MDKKFRDKATELHQRGYCIFREHFANSLIEACRDSFLPILQVYLEENRDKPNRGVCRHFLPMPFELPCFTPEFFFDAAITGILKHAMGERVVADQWGCDVPLTGSGYQEFHVDYKRPLFGEKPDLQLPPYMLVVSFGLTKITADHGAIEIAPGTHTMPRDKAFEAVNTGDIKIESVPLEAGDVLIRHPWALHRGTPNITGSPRAFVSIRYVREWYADASREVNKIPQNVWSSLTPEQQKMMRFPH